MNSKATVVPEILDRKGRSTTLKAGDCLVWIPSGRFVVFVGARAEGGGRNHYAAIPGMETFETRYLGGLGDPDAIVALVLLGRGLDYIRKDERNGTEIVYELVKKS